MFEQLDCANWEQKPQKKGYFQNTKYIDGLLKQRMNQFQKEKALKSKTIKQTLTKTVKKKRVKKKLNSKSQTTKLNAEKSQDLNFYFGEEFRNDQVILKPVQGN